MFDPMDKKYENSNSNNNYNNNNNNDKVIKKL